MTAMAEKERKDSERALIKKDAYELLKETESKKVSYCPQDDRRQRIQSIGQLIQKVTTTIESQEKNKETMKAVIPAYSYLEKQNDE